MGTLKFSDSTVMDELIPGESGRSVSDAGVLR